MGINDLLYKYSSQYELADKKLFLQRGSSRLNEFYSNKNVEYFALKTDFNEFL